MIKSLRKRHLQIWLVLAILIPAGIVCGWHVVPHPAPDGLLQPFTPESLPLIVASTKKSNYIVNIRTNKTKTIFQLEWMNKSALVSPSAIIYMTADSSGNLEGADIVGRIAERGLYHFPLNHDSLHKFHFVLYDIIHHRVIDRLNF